MRYKKYAKVVTDGYSLCAIYEPHPFRSSAISEAVGSHINTGVADDMDFVDEITRAVANAELDTLEYMRDDLYEEMN